MQQSADLPLQVSPLPALLLPGSRLSPTRHSSCLTTCSRTTAAPAPHMDEPPAPHVTPHSDCQPMVGGVAGQGMCPVTQFPHRLLSEGASCRAPVRVTGTVRQCFQHLELEIPLFWFYSAMLTAPLSTKTVVAELLKATSMSDSSSSVWTEPGPLL